MKVDDLILNKYRVLEFIASGQFAAVFRAYEEFTDREVAIKALHKSAYPENRMKFLFGEFRTMSKIWGHPNIVSIHTVEPEYDRYVALIVMEYVEGKSLHDRLQDGRLNLTDVLNIGLDICRGLKIAHAHRIVHRDIKPQNILLTTENEAKIADFTIARIFGDNTEYAKTEVGTQRYMSPEQTHGSYDHRADLYATALILYQAATGRFPFSGEKREIERKKAGGKIEEFHRCPEVLQNFFQKAFHRDLEQRHKNAEEMYKELDSIRQGEYIKQAEKLIDTSGRSGGSGLAETLERCRKRFKISLADADRMNQNLFYEKRKKDGQSRREKLRSEMRRHYDSATRCLTKQDYQGALAEIQKANRLAINDQELIKISDTLLEEFRNADLVCPANASVEDIVRLIKKLPDNEEAVLRVWFEKETSEDEDTTEIPPIQPRVKASANYRIIIEEASPEFLLEQVHNDIQYPHEVEASQIFGKIRIHERMGRSRESQGFYKKLGQFYQKQATSFAKKNELGELELVANCYMRARFAYTVAEKQRQAKANAKKGGVYYMRLARQFELKRSWEEAGKSYILAAYNYVYSDIQEPIEECYRMATVCYFNAAESAHLNKELQMAYDFYTLVVAIGEKMTTPTKMVSEAQKLISDIPVVS